MDDAPPIQSIAESVSASLGTPQFRTDLYLPRYPAGEIGPWRVQPCALHLGRGYWGDSYVVVDMPALLRLGGRGWETWMSMSPYELESQELGCRYAYGHTVVMGLGMGWVAINAALNPRVDKVTVIERDPDVISLIEQSGVLRQAPAEAAGKIAIVQADALEWRAEEPVDFLYADIWLHIAEPGTVEQVRRMQANVGAETIYFWGQEMVIRDLAAPRPIADRAILDQVIRERIDLPLLVPEEVDYPAMIRSALDMKAS